MRVFGDLLSLIIIISIALYRQINSYSNPGNTMMQPRKWYFVTKIVLTYCEKKLFQSRFAVRKVQTKKLVLGDFQNIGHLKVLNDTKLILNDKGCHSRLFRTNLVSFRTFICSVFPKPVSWLRLIMPLLPARRLQWEQG